jgi:hypothetical protein
VVLQSWLRHQMGRHHRLPKQPQANQPEILQSLRNAAHVGNLPTEMINLILAVFAASLLIIIIMYSLPFILLVGAAWLTIKVAKMVYRNHLAAVAEAAENDRLISVRADRQHQQIIEGNEDAGTYGDFRPTVLP